MQKQKLNTTTPLHCNSIHCSLERRHPFEVGSEVAPMRRTKSTKYCQIMHLRRSQPGQLPNSNKAKPNKAKVQHTQLELAVIHGNSSDIYNYERLSGRAKSEQLVCLGRDK
ncbi:uncharacterized protein LOC128862696 [Anastrepha ludens]|uniref:uncharacterized protein LOC128862696 n=1 Tax=Anastrepha ludens TaxID=28586 RepID=UPI0023AF2D49|nr:uncharacterized protein LOC128862696 [Anastrepha ludens]